MVSNDRILYLFGFSPNKVMQLENLINIINEQIDEVNISVVLLHDAVIGLSDKGKSPALVNKLFKLPIRLYVLDSDVLARGINIEDINQVVKCINYDEMVDLLAENHRIVSWM